MNTTSLDQIKERYYGEKGTPERDNLERELEALRIGIKIWEVENSGGKSHLSGVECATQKWW